MHWLDSSCLTLSVPAVTAVEPPRGFQVLLQWLSSIWLGVSEEPASNTLTGLSVPKLPVSAASLDHSSRPAEHWDMTHSGLGAATRSYEVTSHPTSPPPSDSGTVHQVSLVDGQSALKVSRDTCWSSSPPVAPQQTSLCSLTRPLLVCWIKPSAYLPYLPLSKALHLVI